jgi:gamma-glutamyltranspeptidase/glutathione hydrolase
MRTKLACVLLMSLSPPIVNLSARQPERAKHAMVVAQEPLAADVGLRVLQSGGNAIDAAVAIGFALAVTYPYAGNIGGGGFLLARFADGRSTFIDFREKAPLAATRNMYLDSKGNVTEDSLVGWRSAGVPGTVRGLELAHQKYGRKPWAELLDPAIQLAGEVYTVCLIFYAYFSKRALWRETRPARTERDIEADTGSRRERFL